MQRTEHPWLSVAERLRRHYGSPAEIGPRYSWQTLVDVVAGPRRRHGRGKPNRDDDAPELAAARATAESRLTALTQALKASGRSTRRAGVLNAIARWWLNDPRRIDEEAAAWEQPLETLRGELRQIGGVSLPLADRILLFVGGLPTFPVDRAVMRVICRHGWLDPTSDYAEWQAFCAHDSLGEGDRLLELSEHIARLGRDHCGPIPTCDNCPLATLLPSSGPLPLDADEP